MATVEEMKRLCESMQEPLLRSRCSAVDVKVREVAEVQKRVKDRCDIAHDLLRQLYGKIVQEEWDRKAHWIDKLEASREALTADMDLLRKKLDKQTEEIEILTEKLRTTENVNTIQSHKLIFAKDAEIARLTELLKGKSPARPLESRNNWLHHPSPARVDTSRGATPTRHLHVESKGIVVNASTPTNTLANKVTADHAHISRARTKSPIQSNAKLVKRSEVCNVDVVESNNGADLAEGRKDAPATLSVAAESITIATPLETAADCQTQSKQRELRKMTRSGRGCNRNKNAAVSSPPVVVANSNPACGARGLTVVESGLCKMTDLEEDEKDSPRVLNSPKDTAKPIIEAVGKRVAQKRSTTVPLKLEERSKLSDKKKSRSLSRTGTDPLKVSPRPKSKSSNTAPTTNRLRQTRSTAKKSEERKVKREKEEEQTDTEAKESRSAKKRKVQTPVSPVGKLVVTGETFTGSTPLKNRLRRRNK